MWNFGNITNLEQWVMIIESCILAPIDFEAANGQVYH